MLSHLSILVATDFSPEAYQAAERAILINASVSQIRGTMLHVVDQSQIHSNNKITDAPTNDQEVIDDALQALIQFIGGVPRRSDFTLKPLVEVGNPAEIIMNMASDFDMLIIGAHSEKCRWVLDAGTISRKLLDSAIRPPILFVKRKPYTAYKRVLVAVDFSAKSLDALRFSSLIAHDALIYPIHILENLYGMKMLSSGVGKEGMAKYQNKLRIEAEEKMANLLESSGINRNMTIMSIESGHVLKKIFELVRKSGHDLIVVGKHKKSVIDRVLFGSVTKYLVSHSSCDVLVIG